MTLRTEGGPRKIAVVDDDPGMRDLIGETLGKAGCEVVLFGDAESFLQRAGFEDYDLTLCDLELPGSSGLDVLLLMQRQCPDAPFVIVTGRGSIPIAVRAMKSGAKDFLTKPFRVDALLETVERCARPPRGRPEAEPSSADTRDFAVGKSPAFMDLLAKARRVADSTWTVLLRGETGTGKEVIARYIASFGPRADKAFISVNCAAMPEALIESELFGHAKGAFTGATGARRGLFEEAQGGTLFLDEIGSMPLAAQAKVLHALEDRTIRRVGENRAIGVDARILAATNLDIESAVARGTFREDLYYRLAVVTLRIPPLRERGDDALLLADYVLAGVKKMSGKVYTLSASARQLLLNYPFPGNVRELKHAVEQACALAVAPVLEPGDFPFLAARHDLLPSAVPAREPNAVKNVTAESLRGALAQTNGNRVAAARLLGVSRATFYRLLHRFGMGVETPAQA